MSGPEAIRVRYAGIRFRSRTEARWAVFFDRLGLDWVYEFEGYELDSGPYLPDFLLPRLDEVGAWLEVKGVGASSLEIDKCTELARVTQRPVYLAQGAPITTLGGQDTFLRLFWPSQSGVITEHNHCFGECPECGRVAIVAKGAAAAVCGLGRCTNSVEFAGQSQKLLAAYQAARLESFWQPGARL